MSSLNNIIAMDVGARSARVVWVSLHGSEAVVTRAESVALPMDEEDPHKLIAAWVDSLGLSKKFCAVSLAGSQTVFQCGRIMPNDPRSPEEVAAMDIAQFSEMAGDEMVHDVFSFEPPNEPNVKRYIMSMARPAVVQEAISGTKANHLRPADLISAPVALYNAVESWAGEHERPWCYVSIGHSETEIAVGLKKGLLFARAIATGGKLFTDAVVKATGLPPVQAEVRKHGDCGLGESDACFAELRDAADRWIQQYNACVGVYRSQFQDRKLAIEKVVLSGGGAQLKGFKDYFAAKLGIPVITSEELRGITRGTARAEAPSAAAPAVPPKLAPAGSMPDMSKVERPAPGPTKMDSQFDIAYGLALTALHAGVAYLSLLPAELKDEVVFRQKKPWWIAAAVFLLAAMGLYSATGLVLIHRDKALLEGEQQKLDRRVQIDKQIQATRLQCAMIQTNAVPLNELLVNGPLARDVLTLVASTVDPNDWITLFCDEKIYNPEEQEEEAKATDLPKKVPARNTFALFRSLRPATAKAAAAAAAAADKKEPQKKKELMEPLSKVFIVEGYTPDQGLKTVKEMITRLKTSPEIARVDLRSDDKVLKPTGIPELEDEKIPTFQRFVLEIEVKRP
jgi:Tfp pilus assembly PilM family ATPase